MDKALSIQQPWAWLIANGFKDIENRTWRTNFRGLFYIHAGKKLDLAGYQWVAENFPHIPLPAPKDLQLGGLVGTAVLTQCHLPQRPAVSPWHFEDRFGFRIEQAAVIPFEPMPGKLNFFKIERATVEA